jgi:hypothetical protein
VLYGSVRADKGEGMSFRIVRFILLVSLLFLNACTRYTGFESLLGLFLLGGQPVLTENAIVLHQTGGTTAVIEGAPADTLAYNLAQKPSSAVTLTISTSSPRILLNGASSQTLVFDENCPSASCYSDPQTITVSAVDNAAIDGDVTVQVTAAAASSDSAYSGVSGPTAEVSAYDNDGPLSIVPGTTSITLSEGGSAGSASIRLSRDPGAAVTVNVGCVATEARVNGSGVCPVALSYDSTNWSSPQTVTISAVDNATAEGLHTSSIVLSSPDFAGTRTISLSINDNDSAGAVVALPVGGINVTEGGATNAYTVKLTSEPSANVTLSIAYSSQVTVNGSASPATLTFTPANWNTPQTLTVAAADDSLLEGAHNVLLTHSFSGGGYGAVSISDVTAAVTDNDTAGISITESGGSTAIGEAGTTDSYKVKLTSEPSGSVTVSIAFDAAEVALSGPGGASTTSPYTFSIAAANWNTDHTITVSAVNDTDIEGSHSASLVHSTSGGGYGSAPSVTVTASIADDDSTGITIVQSGGSTAATEGGSADTYTVKLNSAPAGDVTVSIAFSGTQVSVNGSTTSPRTLTFTSANWNTAQTVSVAALSDTAIEGAHSVTLAHTVASAADPLYNALGHVSADDISVAITDNVQNAWWDAAYAYRRKITFSCSHPAYTTDYTVSFTIDTSDSTRFDASGDNVRIVWQPASGTVSELNRVGYNWGTTSTRIDFRVASNIAANVCPESPDGSYYVYYKRTGAATPPADETAVYYFADFFNRADSTSVGGWTEWLQNTSGTTADVLLSGGWLSLKGGAVTAWTYPEHWMEAGVSRRISASAMTLPFRAEFDWFVPEHPDLTTGPHAGTGWSRDNDFHFGFSLGDFSTTDHRSIIGGKTGDSDSWVAVNLLMGEGGNSTPDPFLDAVDHGCPGSIPGSADCAYFAMQPRFDNGSNPSLNRINNAPGFTHNPWNWDPSPGQTALLRLRLDVDPGATAYAVWLNDTQRMTSLPFIAPSAPLTHVRIFQSHYTDYLPSISFDATPPQRFDNLRVFYPAEGTAGAEAGP